MGKTKTGVQLIAQERKEQVQKHGFNFEDHDRYYRKQELIQAALFCLNQVADQGLGLKTGIKWPEDWGKHFEDKIIAKDAIGKLKVAGALIAAEIDRLQFNEL